MLPPQKHTDVDGKTLFDFSVHVLQLLHDEAVDHVGHVCGDFARREAELAVEQPVDVAQRVGKSVLQFSPRGSTAALVQQLPLKTLPLLRSHTEKLFKKQGMKMFYSKVKRASVRDLLTSSKA